MAEKINREPSLKNKGAKSNNKNTVSQKPNFSENTVSTNVLKETTYSPYEKDSKISKEARVLDHNELNDSLFEFDLKASAKPTEENKLLLDFSISENNASVDKRDLSSRQIDDILKNGEPEKDQKKGLFDNETEPKTAKKKTKEKKLKQNLEKNEAKLEKNPEKYDDLSLIQDLEQGEFKEQEQAKENSLLKDFSIDLNDKSKNDDLFNPNENGGETEAVFEEPKNSRKISKKAKKKSDELQSESQFIENYNGEKDELSLFADRNESDLNKELPGRASRENSLKKTLKNEPNIKSDEILNRLIIVTPKNQEKPNEKLDFSKNLIGLNTAKDPDSVPFRASDKSPTFLDKSKIFAKHNRPEVLISHQVLNFQHRRSPETPNLVSANELRNSIRLKSPESAARQSESEEIQKLKLKIRDYEKIIEQQSHIISEYQKKNSPKLGVFPKPLPQNLGRGTISMQNPIDNEFWKISEEKETHERLQDMSSLKDLWILNIEPVQSVSSLKKNSGVKANALNKLGQIKASRIRSKFLPKLAKEF